MTISRKTEPETAGPRLYLVTATDCPPADLTAALEVGDIACVLLQTGALDEGGALDEDGLRAAVEVLCPMAQARGVAVLLEDRVEIAAATGCDGVHLSDPKALAAARRRLGEEAIVGVGCGASRHDAITAAERGADYVAFGTSGQEPGPAEIELIDWWQSIMTLPCVAFGAAAPGDCALLAGAGADFVVTTPDQDLAACRVALNQS